jgi:hypothetical protein
MSFLLRLLRAVASLRASPVEVETQKPEPEAPAARPAAPKAPAAAPEPRNLLECSIKLRPLQKSHEVRPVHRGAFTRVIVNTKERVRLTGGFDKQAAGLKLYDKPTEPIGPEVPVKDLRVRPAGPKRRPLLVLLQGGEGKDDPDGNTKR